MDTTVSENDKTLGASIHLSTFLKYVFPLANFLVPIILWTINKERPFIHNHGKRAINFQLSIFIYSLIVALISLVTLAIFALDFFEMVDVVGHRINHLSPSSINNVSGYIMIFGIFVALLFGLFVLELYAVISAAINAANGKPYKYPLCIPFLQTNEIQLNNEHVS